MGFKMNEEWKTTHKKKCVAQELLPHETKQHKTKWMCWFCDEGGNEIIEISDLVEKLPN